MARAPNLSLLTKRCRKEIDGEENHVNITDAPADTEAASGHEPDGDEVDDTSSSLRRAPLYITVYIFPRKAVFGAKPTMNFTPAACECAGHLLIYSKSSFTQMCTLESTMGMFQPA